MDEKKVKSKMLFFKKKKLSGNDRSVSKKIKKNLKWIPKTIYAKSFLLKSLFSKNFNSKNIAIVGHLHHGKSSLVNNLTNSVHLFNDRILFKEFSDFFFLEKQKGHSIYVSLTTLLMCDNKGKAGLYTFLDTPGHWEFFEQTFNAINISEGVILVIDALDGVLLGTEMVLRRSILEGKKIILFINSLDRLVFELLEKPKDIYKKIVKILDEINYILEETFWDSKRKFRNYYFNPIQDNVIFSSFLQKWSFSLEQFAEIYISSQPSICLSIKDMVHKLWSNSRKKKKISMKVNGNIFADFVLLPLYNVIFLILGETILNIREFFKNELGIFGVDFSELKDNRQDLISFSICLFLGGCREVRLIPNHTGLISAMNRHITSSRRNKKFSSPRFSQKKDLIVWVGKFIPKSNQKNFFALSRIISGVLEKNKNLCVLTERNSLEINENFFSTSKIKTIMLPIGRYNLSIRKAPKGSLVLIEGIEKLCRKSGILTNVRGDKFPFEDFFISFSKKLSFTNIISSLSFMVEPVHPKNFKNLYFSIRKCMKLYSNLSCKILSSGEFLLSGTGLLYIDCIVHDLRNVFGDCDLNLSQPLNNSKESILSTSKPFNFVLSENFSIGARKNSNNFSQISFSIDNKFFESFFRKNLNYWPQNKKAFRAGFISEQVKKRTFSTLKDSNLVWFLGPISENFGNCKLISQENNFIMRKEHKNALSEGFELAVSRGPLCFEQMNDVTFSLIKSGKTKKKLEKIFYFPSVLRRLFHWVFLKNKPTQQFPLYFCEIKFPISSYLIISNLINIKKGKILSVRNFSSENICIIRSLFFLDHYEKFKNELQKADCGSNLVSCIFESWEIPKNED